MNDFYKDHFFDNINFVDTNLLNTDILYKAFSGYLTTFSETPSTENYKQLCDFILSQTNKTKSVFDYALTLLIQTFEASDYDEVFIYLTEKYFLQTTCDQDIKAKTLAEKVAALKSLKIGKVAPDIALPDSTGKLVELKNVKNKLVLLLFWSSQCEHCEAMMPQLKKVYEKYKSLGLEILAVSMDTDKNSWLTAIRKNKMEWINVSDLKSINGEFAKKYNVWQTPTFIMLNQDQKIIAKPFTPKQIDEKLGEIL
jgi:peroxiredoxin